MRSYYKLSITDPLDAPSDPDTTNCANQIIAAIKMREKYVYSRSLKERDDLDLIEFKKKHRSDPFSFHAPPKNLDTGVSHFWKDGVICIAGSTMTALNYEEFTNDLKWLYFTVCCGKEQFTFCNRRIKP